MLVILKKNAYSFSDEVVGRKVIGKIRQINGTLTLMVKASEISRLGVRRDVLYRDLNSWYIFLPTEFTAVKSTLEDCSDSNVGKGWEGYYDQPPIKKSNFR